ncbi:MAG: hypothetical protein J6M66_14030, partial [Lachnospiraceae bacterium]|nr:hypothetical protein [Lachnospiraceae bacterium]
MSLYKETMDQIVLSADTQQKLKELYADRKSIVDKQGAKADKKINSFGYLAAAAAIAVCVMVSGISYYENMEGGQQATTIGGHNFTLKVLAAEQEEREGIMLERGKSVILADSMETGGFVIDNTSQEVSYEFEYRFLCEGEHINRVTYSVNKGVLQICEPKDQTGIAVETETAPYKDYGKTIRSQGAHSEDYVNPVFYSYTVDYGRQLAPDTVYKICGTMSMEDIGDISEDALPRYAAEGWINREYVDLARRLLDDVVITCTVQYDDGTSENAQIKVIPQIVTAKD